MRGLCVIHVHVICRDQRLRESLISSDCVVKVICSENRRLHEVDVDFREVSKSSHDESEDQTSEYIQQMICGSKP